MPPRIPILPARSALSLVRTAPVHDTIHQTTRKFGNISLHSSKCNTPLPHRSLKGVCSYRMSSSSSGSSGKHNGSGVGEQPLGPNQDQLPHVSEEAAATAQIMGKKCGEVGGPELEQGTPVADILKRDKEALKNMPKVLRDEAAANQTGNGSKRSFSTSARLHQGEVKGNSPADPSAATVANMLAASNRGESVDVEKGIPEGFKYEPPTLPLPPNERFDRRYEPLVEQFTKLIMKHGKLSLAQKHMAKILEYLRTAPAPLIDPSKPFLPGPPSPQLPLNPILYLTLAVDSIAPLFRIRQIRGIAGGGAALPIPSPLAQRQRRREAITWILDAAEKRRDNQLSHRIANEIIAIAEGKSSVWLKRAAIHKQATVSRANIRRASQQRRGRKQ
ncbi:30S ribosomal protein S7 [Trichophyton tonsurans CBS 112818]|uniref:Small ribosomal subunit protein uS7m n=1 Tax=Trichophyton tonsurans (strain CBS 112818) TaxID=647933 RepID=F2S6B0_TRIT1|nr:30S ribosomal protein S7 [Trichophyton tonsurans CBS 112818]